jgi:predicted CoA-binding protein/ubiquinone/menaquinone biosynthesis C-methylase UbiE
VDEAVRSILIERRTWAVVGCSPDPSRDSNRIARLLMSRGYRVIPVNPAVDEVLGERCYPSVRDIPAEEGVEVVDVFRRSDAAGAHVDEAIEAGAKAVWLQLGVIDEAAAQRAREAGLDVVMDRCPAIELPRLGIDGPRATANGRWREEILEVKHPPEDVPRIYSRLARVYEVWARLTESRARRRVLELAALKDGESVLEVATGTGVQLVELARRNPSGRTAGLEPSDGMLAETRKRLRAAGLEARVALVQGSALELPFEDTSFDLLTNGYMLDLLPRDDIPRALREFRRVLRPGGRLVMSNMTKGERPLHRTWDRLYERGIVLTANCRGVLAAPVLDELGFEDVRREYIAQMAFPTEVVFARRPS